jgi:hypothetical protein
MKIHVSLSASRPKNAPARGQDWEAHKRIRDSKYHLDEARWHAEQMEKKIRSNREEAGEHARWRDLHNHTAGKLLEKEERVQRKLMKSQSNSKVKPMKMHIAISNDSRPQRDEDSLTLKPGAKSHPVYKSVVQELKDDGIEEGTSRWIAKINKAIDDYDQAEGKDDVEVTEPAGNRAATDEAAEKRKMQNKGT